MSFNPRAPCGARLPLYLAVGPPIKRFNPRAPCGARPYRKVNDLKLGSFQSTRPVRGATFYQLVYWSACAVSIHAPRAGRDQCGAFGWMGGYSFNPRAPCGARRLSANLPLLRHAVSIHAPRAGRDGHTNTISNTKIEFQSTRPVRGATFWWHLIRLKINVSIHAPRAGRDPNITKALKATTTFQSTRPVRGATRT